MRLPIDWLREFTSVPDDPGTLAEQFTQLGLEVEEIIRPAEALEGLTTVTLEATESHPNRDDLTVCEITDGQEPHRVVTAASNLTVGSRYVWARPGARLDDQPIESESFAGVSSDGMLCSLEELGLTGTSGSLLELTPAFPVGDDPVEQLHLETPILDIDLTPNRADCLSLIGLARDYGAYRNQNVDLPAPPTPDWDRKETPDVRIDAPDRCTQYHGIRVDGVPTGPSSPKIQRRLVQMGLQPRNAIVDLTNYVLFEQGNPLHAFDLDRIKPTVVVRNAYDDETLTTLDGTERELETDHLVIADQEDPQALAGIMGGAPSAVSDSTSSIFLEGADFEPAGIRRTGQQLKIHTDSSHRFERGVDSRNVRPTMNRFLQLLSEETDGSLQVHEPVEAGPGPEDPSPIPFSPQSYGTLVGYSLDRDSIQDTFRRLGMSINKDDESSWTVTPPSWRHDLQRPEDLVEELLRLEGYETVPSSYPTSSVAASPRPSADFSRTIRGLLGNSGFRETVTFSFQPEDGVPVSKAVSFRRVKNPLSEEHAVLRRSLLDRLVPVFEKNYEAGDDNLRFFEIGRVFPESSEQEPQHLALLAAGNLHAERWDEHHRTFDFYDLKGIIERVLTAGGYGEIDMVPDEQSGFEPKRCARVTVGDQTVGYLGKIPPEDLPVELETPCWGAELNLSNLGDPRTTSYEPFSKEPYVKRDLDLVVDRSTYARDLKETIRDSAEWLERVEIFDLYRGEPLPEEKKSISFRLYFRAESRTLSDTEVNETQEDILDALRSNHGASLRDE
jgi:phenylalanyl-tRNA synthetase beta chain